MPSDPVVPEVDPGGESDQVDLAVVAYRDAGDWLLDDLPDDALADLASIAEELRGYDDADDALALVSVDEDFFLLVRVTDSDVGVLLSDAGAASDWPLARSALDHLGVRVEEDDDPAPAGDLGLLADLGFPAIDMGVLLDDLELYPDEQLSDIATKLGFGSAFDDLAGLSDT